MRTTLISFVVMMTCAVSGCERVGNIFGRTQPFEAPEPQPERQARPVAAALDADAIVVAMDDGTQCLGAAGAAGRANGWTGTLAECAYPYTYEVVLAAGTLPGQVALYEAETTILVNEDEVPFRPLVVVTVTTLFGQSYRFESSSGF